MFFCANGINLDQQYATHFFGFQIGVQAFIARSFSSKKPRPIMTLLVAVSNLVLKHLP
jgi:hypothetical protein